MDQPRALSDLMNEAHRRAARHAPPPDWHPLHGGLAMAGAFAVPMGLFASMNAEVSLPALILNAIVGFAVGFFALKRKQNAYDRAFNRELEALRGGDAPAPASDAPTRPTLGARLPKWLKRNDAG